MSEWFFSIDMTAAGWIDGLLWASWQGALAILVAWAVVRWCTFLTSRMQCWIWRLVCLKLLVALFWWQPIGLPVLPATTRLVESSLITGILPLEAQIDGAVLSRGEEAELPVKAAPASGMPWYGMLVSVWLAGVLGRVVITLGEWFRMRTICRSAVPMTEGNWWELCREESLRIGTTRMPRLLQTHLAEGPLLAGVKCPSIILPQGLDAQLNDLERRLMLAHELAHLKRRDLWWNWLPTMVGWLFFFHPLVWVLTRLWWESQEAACDELVIQRRVATPVEYARLLLKLATHWPEAARSSLLAAGVLGGYRPLERRIHTLSFIRHPSRRRLVLAVGALMFLSVPAILPWRLVAREPERNVESDKVTGPRVPIDSFQGVVVPRTRDEGPSTTTGEFRSEAEFRAANEEIGRVMDEVRRLGGSAYWSWLRRGQGGGVSVLLNEEWTGGDDGLRHVVALERISMLSVSCSKVTPDGLAEFRDLDHCSSLHLLRATDEHLRKLEGWDTLAELVVTGPLVTDAGLASLEKLTGLVSVTIHGDAYASNQDEVSKISDDGIAALKGCKELKRLSIGGLPQVTGASLDELSELEQLGVQRIALEDDGLAKVAALEQLKILYLDAERITSQGYEPVAGMDRLEQLYIYHDEDFDDAAAEALVALKRSRDVPGANSTVPADRPLATLSLLSLRNTKLTDAGLLSLGQLGSLRDLSISGGTFSDAGILHLKDLVGLQGLELWSDLKVTDTGLQVVAGMQKLQRLSLPVADVTDAGLKALAECRYLERLNLGRSQITGSGFAELNQLTELRELFLNESQVDDAGVAHFARFAALEHLNLDDTRITDAGLASLGKLSKLRRLDLNRTAVTDQGLNELSKLNGLRLVSVIDTKVSAEGARALQELLKHVFLVGDWNLQDQGRLTATFVGVLPAEVVSANEEEPEVE